jgi:hypothetical protein
MATTPRSTRATGINRAPAVLKNEPAQAPATPDQKPVQIDVCALIPSRRRAGMVFSNSEIATIDVADLTDEQYNAIMDDTQLQVKKIFTVDAPKLGAAAATEPTAAASPLGANKG